MKNGPGIYIQLEVDLPLMPNFLKISGSDAPSIDVADMTDDDLRRFTEHWSKVFIEHAKARRKSNET